jgi:hypothetical protein
MPYMKNTKQNNLEQEITNLQTRIAEAKRLLSVFVYKGIDDAFAKGKLLETIRASEIRVKEIQEQIKSARKVEL